MGVNQSRSVQNESMNRAIESAKLIGFNKEGLACVWTGGYSFSVYDAARDWSEVNNFTSGQMVDFQNKQKARELMETKGFKVVE